MKLRPLVITVGERNCVLSGSVNARILEIIREMPGRRRWNDNNELLFEPSAGNIRHLKKGLPEAKWENADKRLKEIAAADKEGKEALARKSRKLPPEAARSFPFVIKPYNHQLRAFERFKKSKYFGLLFDIGTGKSKTMIDIAAYKYMAGEIDAFFILVWPSGVAKQYIEDAIPTHMPRNIKYVADWYSPARRNKHPEELFKADDKLRCYAMNIEAISRTGEGRKLAERFLRSGRTFFLIVESFTIKAPGSERTEWCTEWGDEAKVRAIETGWPTPEGLEDLYPQMKFLSEDILGFSSFYTFRNRYCDTIPAYKGAPHGAVRIVGYRNVKELWDAVDKHCMRVLADDCLDLPKARFMNWDIKMTPEQQKIYDQLADKFEYLIDHSGGHIKADQAIVRMMRMQQVLCGHVPIVESINDDGTENVKATLVKSNRAKAVIDIWEEGKRAKMIIWGRFHKDYEVIAREIADMKKPPKLLRYDGTVDTKQRAANLASFIADKSIDWIFINPATGSAGLDGLQKVCQLVVLYSKTFKSLDYYQLLGRTRRVGAVGSCLYVNIRVPKSQDDYIDKAIVRKTTVAHLFLDDPEGWKTLASGG